NARFAFSPDNCPIASYFCCLLVAQRMNWFKLRTLCILQGNDYVAIFEPMFTRPGRVAVDGVYCSGTGTDGAVVPACDVTETLRALYLCTLCVIRRSGCCADWRDRPEISAALCSDGYLVV